MNWNLLQEESQLEEIKEKSNVHPVLIFKHSTRCNISSTAKARLERKWKEEQAGNLQPYYLDLLSFRSLSNRIADTFDVPHQSPQALLIHKGECMYATSHFDISFDDLTQHAQLLEA